MKIRLKTYLNNITVGLLPLILVSVIFLFTYSSKSRQYVLDNMDVSINNLKMFIEDDLEKFRDYAFFLARDNSQKSREQALYNFKLNKDSIFGIRQKLRNTEIFINTNNVFRDMARWRDYVYNIDDQEAGFLWKELDQDQHSRRYTVSIPNIKNGNLVFRNCALLHKEASSQRLGFIALSLPLDINYFQDLSFHDPGAIYFIQTSKGLVFSDPAFQNQEVQDLVAQSIREKVMPGPFKIKDKGTYYIHRSTYIPLNLNKGIGSGNSWVYLGVLFNEQKLNKQFLSFQKMYRLSMILSLALIFLIAIWFSDSLVKPLKQLQDQVRGFERNYQKILPPLNDRDEITQLQASISRMSDHILANQQIIEQERDHLRKKQESQLNELEMARSIQASLLPLSSPMGELNFIFLSMEEVSGDFFDFIELSPHETGIFIADVSGHGVPAAFITAMLKSFCYQNHDKARDPEIFISRCNHFLLKNIGANFITALYGIYDSKKKTFSYSNAGHPEPIVIHGKNIFTPFNGQKGPCLGVFSDNDLENMSLRFQRNTLKLSTGDRLLLFTDGLVETIPYHRRAAEHGKGEEFGEKELMLSIQDFLESEQKHLIPFLVDRLRKYRQAYDFEDDICIISIDIE